VAAALVSLLGRDDSGVIVTPPLVNVIGMHVATNGGSGKDAKPVKGPTRAKP